MSTSYFVAADWLIEHALRRRGIEAALPALDDSYETAAHDVAFAIVKRGA